ncbi:MAG: MaoC family dehydratase [Deltaproteobacteria bacterium]|nr:MaoC family dehydratase [Deltaproteobacteria bacterium]
MTEILTFDAFSVGKLMGSRNYTIDQAAFERWISLYPQDEAHHPITPPGIVLAAVMRAYMSILSPRPEGNIHAGQEMEMFKLPRIGDTVSTEITVGNKEIRKGRRWVHLDTVSRDKDGGLVCLGKNTTIWAR